MVVLMVESLVAGKALAPVLEMVDCLVDLTAV